MYWNSIPLERNVSPYAKYMSLVQSIVLLLRYVKHKDSVNKHIGKNEGLLMSMIYDCPAAMLVLVGI
jgi:hypothetical protein